GWLRRRWRVRGQPLWYRADAVIGLALVIRAHGVLLAVTRVERVLSMILKHRPFTRTRLTKFERSSFDGRDPPGDMASWHRGRSDRHITVALNRVLRLARQQAGLVCLKHKYSWPLRGAMVHRKWEWDCKCKDHRHTPGRCSAEHYGIL